MGPDRERPTVDPALDRRPAVLRDRFFLVPGTGTVYVDSKLSVIRRRAVGNGFREELKILNHDEKPVDLTIRIDAGSDCADLFEVKDAPEEKGTYIGARRRAARPRVSRERSRARRTSPHERAASTRRVTFKTRIEPRDEWSTNLDVVTAVHGSDGANSRHSHGHAAPEHGAT
jgi:hypothetical protein